MEKNEVEYVCIQMSVLVLNLRNYKLQTASFVKVIFSIIT